MTEEKVKLLFNNSTQPQQRGVALMLVLWVMAILSIIVAEFAFSMRTELKIAGNYKEEAENYYRAQAAIQQALTEILHPDVAYHYVDGGKLIFGKKEQTLEGEAPAQKAETENTVPQRGKLPLNNGFFSYKIEDEEGKIYLNRFAIDNEPNRQILSRLLEMGGNVTDEAERETIIDSIMDWLDKDDLHKINGAEDDYYKGLDPPYECKDGPFDTVEELLLVKGMTPQILFGTTDEQGTTSGGIAKYLTVWGTNRFNPYTADETTRVIMFGEEQAAAMELYDENGKPKNRVFSTRFSIIGRGYPQTGAGQRMVKAVVVLNRKNGVPSARIMHWNDNLIGYPWDDNQKQNQPDRAEN
ncbi:MAG: general secretion pathway protein GspK [Candidatus Schekmanbacteria bacterium]|nr:general secretion pathway protein GspK [Candidatus Schekmanbacteria bacterium]